MSNLISDFSDYLIKIHNASQNTLQSYCRDVARFMSKNGFSGEKDCLSLGREQLQSYIDSLVNEGLAGSTVLRNAASLRNLYGYFISCGLLSENPAALLSLPRVSHKSPTVLTPGEINRLISAPKSDEPKGIRDKAMLELLYATGMKATELINIEIRDVDFDKAAVLCKSKEHTRMIPIGSSAESAVRKYVKEARPALVEDKRVKALFVNCAGKPMTRQGFWKLIKAYIASAGIDKPVTLQTLRHSFAVHLLQNGADTESVSRMLGYNDSVSTRVYSNMLSEDLKKVYNHSHPRA